MSKKKIFFLLLAVSTGCLLMYQVVPFSRTLKAFRLSCSSVHSSPKGNTAKHTSVMFLKTHKTASSTVQNILFRFAERHNLTVALPITACNHQFCYPQLFSSHYVHPHTMPPDIITSHLRFSHSELHRVLPNNTIYITILREPGAMFESLFSYYYGYCESFKRVPNGSLEAFLNQPWVYYSPQGRNSMYSRNTVAFDLGGDKDHPKVNVESYAKRFAAEVESVFSLVMIAEYFDESLVLLRRLLSWDLEDMLYIKQNMRTISSKKNLSEELTAKIRDWNAIDAVLYDHFNASLWRQLSELGLACVAQEVQLLRRARDQVMRRCFGGQLPQLGAQIANKELRPWQPSSEIKILGYDLPLNGSAMPHDMCLKMVLPESQYTTQLQRLWSVGSEKLPLSHRHMASPKPPVQKSEQHP